MRIDRFEIERGVTGVTIMVEVSVEVEVKFDSKVHREFVVGFNYDDKKKLAGEESFVELRFRTTTLQNLSQAKRAAQEVKAILDEVRCKEQNGLEWLQVIENYLRGEFEEFITR